MPQAALDAVTPGPSLLAPATLVKVAGAPSVYVVDGLSRLVHLPVSYTHLTLPTN